MKIKCIDNCSIGRPIREILLGLLLSVVTSTAHSADNQWTEYKTIDEVLSLRGGLALYIEFVVPNTVNPSVCSNPAIMVFRLSRIPFISSRSTGLGDSANDFQVEQIMSAAESGKRIRFLISGVECGTTAGALSFITGIQREYQ